MRKVLYCKYNENRNPRFQTKTCIYQDEKERYIEKEPLTEASRGHIQAFSKNYESVKKLYPNITFIPCEWRDGIIRYPFVEGKNMDTLLKELTADWDDLFAQVQKLIDNLYEVNPENICSFQMTDGFRERFGDVDCSEERCISPCNLDMIFDNLTVTQSGEVKAFDYEWVCDFPVPEKYVIYRVLCRFYDKYFGYISPKCSFKQYIARFGFNEKEQNIFRKMEDSLIQFIYVGGEPAFQAEQYFKKRTTFRELCDIQHSYEDIKDNLNQTLDILHNTEKEYLLTIERLQNAANTVAQLEQQCKNMQPAYAVMSAPGLRRLVKPLYWCGRGIKYMRRKGIKATANKARNKLRNRSLAKKTAHNMESSGTKSTLLSLIEVDKKTREEQRRHRFDKEVKISIITPLFNTPDSFLTDLLESVENQTYGNWEFCLVNFSTTDFERVDSVCRRYAEKDSRISYHTASRNNGISENTNECISYATGEYIGLLDHDDILHPCALYEAVKAINETAADFIYTDEVKFTKGMSDVFSPNFKPDFSMDELRAHNYICHFNVYKKSLYDEVGGYRKEFDGSQDHDIVLRLTERAEKIIHIPKILYYWRVHPNSVAQSIEAKSYATDAGAGAVTDQLKRYGEKQYAESVMNHIPLYRIHSEEVKEPDVTIVIWNSIDREQVQESLSSLSCLEKCSHVVIEEDGRSLGERWNEAMRQADTTYVLFLMAGLKVTSQSLVNEFMIYAHRRDVATIDCKVIAEDDTIFSGGAYLSGDGNMPIKLRCMGGPREYVGYENGMLHSRNVTAATGLCTFVDRRQWEASNGFADTDSMDIMLDYSYNMWKSGRKNLWTPFIEALHMGKEAQQRYIAGLRELSDKEFDEKDAYFSEHILALRLE